MKTLWIDNSIKYDGSQLRSLYAYLEFGILGDSMIAWRGACDVALEHMVDGEDKRVDAAIAGSDMIHFIIEKFNCQLLGAVALQRLLATVVRDVLQSISKKSEIALGLTRDGDDLWFGDRKLSISIATVSPASALIHFAVNVSNEGTPVKTLALQDLAVEPQPFAQAVLEAFQEEVAGIVDATHKVHWVK